MSTLSISLTDLRAERDRYRSIVTELLSSTGAHIDEDGGFTGTYGSWSQERVVTAYKALADQHKVVEIKTKQHDSDAFSGAQPSFSNVPGFDNESEGDAGEPAAAVEREFVPADAVMAEEHSLDFDGDPIAQLELRQSIAAYLLANPETPSSPAGIARTLDVEGVEDVVTIVPLVQHALEFMVLNADEAQAELAASTTEGREADAPQWQVCCSVASDGTRLYEALQALNKFDAPIDGTSIMNDVVDAIAQVVSGDTDGMPEGVKAAAEKFVKSGVGDVTVTVVKAGRPNKSVEVPAATLFDEDTDDGQPLLRDTDEPQDEMGETKAQVLAFLREKIRGATTTVSFGQLQALTGLSDGDMEDLIEAMRVQGQIETDGLDTEVWLPEADTSEAAA